MQNTMDMRIEKVLLESGILDRGQMERIKEIERRTGTGMEGLLISEGIVKAKDLLSLKAEMMHVNFIELEDIVPDPEAIGRIGEDVANRYHVFPFAIKNNLLCLAMKNPDDIFVIDEIKVFAQMEIKPFLADSNLIGKYIRQFYRGEMSSEYSPVLMQKENYEPRKGVKISSIIGKNQKNTSNGNPISAGESVPALPAENASNVSDPIEYILNSVVSKAVKVENITDIHIDMMNRNIKVVLDIKY